MSYKSVALSLSPKGLWMFDEASGTTINDSSGNSQNGTYGATNVTLGSASIISNPGGNGTAVSLAGGNSQYYVGSIPNSATIALTNFTFVVWFQYSSGGSNFAFPFSMDGFTTASNGWCGFADGQPPNVALWMRIDSSTTAQQNVSSTFQVFDGNPHFIAVGVSGQNGFISVDGAAYQTSSFTGAMNAPTVDLTFGNGLGGTSGEVCPGTYQGAALFSGQLSQANIIQLYQAGLGQDVGPQIRPPNSLLRGNDPWWAAPPMLRQHNVVFRAANLPDPYRQSMPPVPAIQQGMAPWQAPPIKAQWNVVFRAANLPDPYRQSMPPVSAWQQGMQQWWAPIVSFRSTTTPFHGATEKDFHPSGFPFQAIQQGWWAPVPALHPTITEFHGATELDWRPVGFPFQALQQAWWAPVPALHPTITEFHGATDRDWHPVGFPFQAIGQPWWAPVWALHPTITELHGATELDFRPTGFPLPAIQQGWQLQYVRIPPYGPNDIGIVAVPFTPTGSPLPAIQRGWWAPAAMARVSSAEFSGAGPPPPPVSGDIARWRFQRRNIGVQGRVRSSGKHGDV